MYKSNTIDLPKNVWKNGARIRALKANNVKKNTVYKISAQYKVSTKISRKHDYYFVQNSNVYRCAELDNEALKMNFVVVVW